MLPALGHSAAFSRAGWLADLDQLQSLLATNYPSLEWACAPWRGPPGHRIPRPPRSALERAQTDEEAHGIFERFLARLGDEHLSIEWDVNPPESRR